MENEHQQHIVSTLPLYEKVTRKNTIPRAIELIILFLLFALLCYRLISLKVHGFHWLLAFLCESWFTFSWILSINSKWNQLLYITYPQRLLQRFRRSELQLPCVDLFVTTADPVLEPTILTVNTVLSFLAVDYPANKLACYVSDDGCSPLTYYSLVEASKFAQLWVPFCKKYNISVRAPFRYFTIEPNVSQESSQEFQHERENIKNEYEKLCVKIEEASQKSVPCDLTGDFAAFSNIKRGDHPTIIKIICENKEDVTYGLPHLIYISREKRPNHPHRFKAGAMNALTRVSGVMTNAPFMLNLDCDMYVNNPEIALHAMCLMLGVKDERDCGFVQSPQLFYDGSMDDPYANQMAVLREYLLPGLSGIQGPLYEGTGCFHRRKVIYGLSPEDNGKLMSDEVRLQKIFGNSIKLSKKAGETLTGVATKKPNLVACLEAARQVASCGYEYGTSWGAKVGWMYGSTAEDMLTGVGIHGRGWRSTCCWPNPPAFLGCTPSGGPAAMVQQKRWSTGLFEIHFTPQSPIISTLIGKLQFRQCLAYLMIMNWPMGSIPEICYAVLPAYCILTNSNFMPKVHEAAFLIPALVFVIYNLYELWEFIRAGKSIRAWWNNQRIGRVNSMTAWLLGAISVALKLLGLSDAVFEVTKKDQKSSASGDETDMDDAGAFTFDESPVFLPGTTVLLINLMAIVVGIRVQPEARYGKDESGFGIGEFACSACVVVCFWPFFKGLFRKGKYGIPSSTICKSGVCALLFAYLCKRITTV